VFFEKYDDEEFDWYMPIFLPVSRKLACDDFERADGSSCAEMGQYIFGY